jgi:hypothetical protein
VLIVAPAAVCLQWQGEMQRRFGLRFEIYNRAFMARAASERGFGVNPWTTHNRFIISYQTLRRPEYRDPLLRGSASARARACSSSTRPTRGARDNGVSKYAVDSRVTKVARLAPRFENRLFLSATPHNGHSNSFSALLELLDPQRFTRGVRPGPRTRSSHRHGAAPQGGPPPARRRQFPRRVLVQHDVGAADAPEVRLSVLLAEYTGLMRPGAAAASWCSSTCRSGCCRASRRSAARSRSTPPASPPAARAPRCSST